MNRIVWKLKPHLYYKVLKIIALVVEVARRYSDVAWRWSEERENIAYKVFFINLEKIR